MTRLIEMGVDGIHLSRDELITRLASVGRNITKDERVALHTMTLFISGIRRAFPELTLMETQEISNKIFTG